MATQDVHSGTVQLYDLTNGYGFIASDADPDEVNYVYFHITVCGIQKPPPQAGERVQFVQNRSRWPFSDPLASRAASPSHQYSHHCH